MEGGRRADNAGDELSGGKLRRIITRATLCPRVASPVCHREPAERMRGRVEGSRGCFFAGVIQAEQACEKNSPPKSWRREMLRLRLPRRRQRGARRSVAA